MDADLLLSAMFIGTVGMGLFIFGKKSENYRWLVIGLVLMIYPYFVHSALIMWLIAAACLVGTFLLGRLGMLESP